MFPQAFFPEPLPASALEVGINGYVDISQVQRLSVTISNSKHYLAFRSVDPLNATQLEHVSFNINGLVEKEVEFSTLDLLDFLESFPQLCSLHFPWFQHSFLTTGVVAKVTTVTVDQIRVYDAVALLDLCPRLQSVTFKVMKGYINGASPQPHSGIKKHMQLQNLAVFAHEVDFMELLQFFAFPALETLALAKCSNVSKGKNMDTRFGTFIVQSNMLELRTLCVGDYGNDVSPVLSLISVLSLVDESQGCTPRHLPLLETLTVPRIKISVANLGPFLTSVSTMAQRRAHQHGSGSLRSLSISIDCPELGPTCLDTVDLKEIRKCQKAGVRKVDLKINNTVLKVF